MPDDIDELQRKVDAAIRERQQRQKKPLEPKTPLGRVLNVGVELVAGVLAGVGLGLLIDWYFDTSPWGLIALFILGSAAGMLNVMRALAPKNDNKDSETKDG